MKDFVIRFYKRLDKILFLWALAFAFNIITLLIIHYQIKPGNAPLALHYQVLIGVDWYGAGKNLYFVPIIGFAVGVVNFVLYRATKRMESFLPQLATFVTLLVQICLLAYVLFLLRVN